MIPVTERISLAENELVFSFVRSSGPGGQNVNKVATAVQLRFDVAGSPSLPERVKTRLAKLAGRRLTADGVLILEARRFRTRERNRTDALERLAALIRKAAKTEKKRRPTRPTKAAKRARMEEKRKRSRTKDLRKKVSGSTPE
jgi:ribosome-associated protein